MKNLITHYDEPESFGHGTLILLCFCVFTERCPERCHLGKQEVIPEFRPFLDTLDDEEEANELLDRIKKIQKYIDDNQSKLQKEPKPSGGTSENLKIENESLHKELKEERERLQLLEYRIKGSQVVARILGCLTYIVLGGIFGTLLAGKIKVEGLNGYLPEYFQSIVIGATWTTYLSVIGLSADRRKTAKNTTEQVQNVQKQIDETFWAYKQSKVIPKEIQGAINQNHVDLLKRVDRMKQVILRKM